MQHRIPILAALLLFTGCAPAIEAELRLIEQSKRGVELVRTSVENRHEIIDQYQARKRDELDSAFDADVEARSAELSSDWVIEARKAYSVAARALEDARARSQQSADVDRQNLDAIDACLVELETLNRAQLNAAAPVTEKLK